MFTLFYALLLQRSYLTSSSDTFRPSSTILSFFPHHSFVYLSFFSTLSQYTSQILTICSTSVLLHSLGRLWSHLCWSKSGPMDGNEPSSQDDGILHLETAVLRGQFCFWKLHYLTTLSVLWHRQPCSHVHFKGPIPTMLQTQDDSCEAAWTQFEYDEIRHGAICTAPQLQAISVQMSMTKHRWR